MFLMSDFVPHKKTGKTISNIFNHSLLTDEKCRDILDETLVTEPHKKKINVKNVFVDLEVFSGNAQNTGSIFDAVDNTETSIGRFYLKELLTNPIDDINEIKERQDICKSILDNEKLYDSLCESLSKINKLEKSIVWLLKKKSNEEARLINSVYFKHKYLKVLNTNENFLMLYNYFKIIFSPMYGLLSPVIFLILPFLYIKFFTNVKFSFETYFKIFKMSFFSFGMPSTGGGNILGGGSSKSLGYTRIFSLILSFIIYVQNVVSSFEISMNTNEIINELHSKLNSLNSFMETSYDICESTKKIFNRESLTHCLPELTNPLFKTVPSIFTNKGKVLITYGIVDKCPGVLDLLKYIGEVDCYLSICKLVKSGFYSFPKFSLSKKPLIHVKQLWHPYLNPKSSVKNDVKIGGDNNPNNLVITGPNAGGKSTFIKSVTLFLLFGQSLGIVPGNEAEFTPFKLLNTYLNIPDCKGKESLFEAEMHRARDHIRELESLDSNSKAFLVMDEIFSSTNPEEGISGGYAIAKKLGEFKNSVTLLTTHFSYLTKLENNTNNYMAYKIPINRVDGRIEYPYKLKRGVSDQFIALELLKHKGFDNDIIENAVEICKNIDMSAYKNIEQSKKEETHSESDVSPPPPTPPNTESPKPAKTSLNPSLSSPSPPTSSPPSPSPSGTGTEVPASEEDSVDGK